LICNVNGTVKNKKTRLAVAALDYFSDPATELIWDLL